MSDIQIEANKVRKTTHKVSPFISGRWSPRLLSGEELADEEFMPLFEAARWAPSSYNNQPWRFIYAKRNTQHWQKLFELMGEWNRSWANNASVLVVVVSYKKLDKTGKPSKTHSFDTGAAWQNLALEAASRNLVAHGMEGFDYEKARKDLQIPDDYQVEAMIAIGKRSRKEDSLAQDQEVEKPSDRKPLKDIVMEGEFRK